jgi:hypothetical protein
MDQATLVKRDRDIGARVIEALSTESVPIAIWDWVYDPPTEEWQLIIATPWIDTKGPRATYRALTDALQKADIYPEVPMRRVFLVSPTDPQARRIEKSEGFVHILKHQTRNQPGYSVVFAPTARSGSIPMRSFWSLDELRKFLSKDLSVRPEKIAEAEHEVEHTGATSLFPVTLTTNQIRRLGL